MKTLFAYLQLFRLANITTAWADVLAGVGVVGATSFIFTMHNPEQFSLRLLSSLLLLLLSVTLLYAGAVAFNDIFDAELDKIERPERPLPSGEISKSTAILWASFLSLLGIGAASMVSWTSGAITLVIVILYLFYDYKAKHSVWMGPVVVGLCRSGSLFMGMSILSSALPAHLELLIIPFTYIAGVTLVSKGEVKVESPILLWLALLLYIVATLCVILFIFTPYYKDAAIVSAWHALPFFCLFVLINFYYLIRAIITLDPIALRKTVKIGILCLIILDATLGAAYVGWWYGLSILLLLPITIVLAKLFAVT